MSVGWVVKSGVRVSGVRMSMRETSVVVRCELCTFFNLVRRVLT